MSRPVRPANRSILSAVTSLGVNAKIIAAVLIAAAVAAAVGVLGIAALATTNDATSAMYAQNFSGLEAVENVRRLTLELRIAVTNHGMSFDDATMAKYESQYADKRTELETAVEAYAASGLGEVRTKALADYKEGLAAYVDVAETELMPASRENDVEAWTTARDEDAVPQIQKMMGALDQIAEREMKDAGDTASAAQSTYTSNRMQVLVLLVAGVVIAVGIGALVARSIVRNLRRVQIVCDALAAGDLTRTANLTSSDEVGQMGQALDTAVGSLRELVGTIEESSGALASAADELAATTTQIASTAEETSAQAGVVSAAAEQVSRNVQSVAAGTEEMGASIHEIANNASSAAEVGRRAVAAAVDTSATMNRLGDASREIGNVVKLITTIAEQTNLLALNATIEAARAGEAGKGFAVVAGEVKELAQETARATEDIGRRVDAIQAETGGALRAIGEIGSIIDSINDYQLTIASAVEQQTATTTEINRSIGEAATGSGEIAGNIAGVAGAADLTTQGVDESRQAVGRLAQMSTELRTLVGRFTV